MLFKSLCTILFICAVPLLASGNDLVQKSLESKIAYTSKGETAQQHFNKLEKDFNLYFIFHDDSKELLKLKTKKFYYPNIRTKYILKRICKETYLTYQVRKNEIHISKDLSRNLNPESLTTFK